jgi:hypothetical protein
VVWEELGKSRALRNEPTPEANGYGVGSAARLKLRQQVADVRLDGLLREEEPLADLSVHEAVGDELQYLDLAHRRLLGEFPERRGERDHRPALTAGPARSRLVEAAAVVHVTAQDLLALCSVHESFIGARETRL